MLAPTPACAVETLSFAVETPAWLFHFPLVLFKLLITLLGLPLTRTPQRQYFGYKQFNYSVVAVAVAVWRHLVFNSGGVSRNRAMLG